MIAYGVAYTISFIVRFGIHMHVRVRVGVGEYGDRERDGRG